MLDTAKHIHLIGIGGIGLSGLAKLLLARGVRVTGSDLVETPITQDLQARGVTIHYGHHASSLIDKPDLIIYSSAVPVSNVERVWAQSAGVPERSYAEALGEFSRQYSTIVVTGTHGKSTTTAMLGLILEAAGYDPTVLVGSLVPTFPDGNIRIGHSRFFVVEGCEYQANVLNLHPESIVITNIEMDHPDFYRDIDHVRGVFQELVDRLGGNGLVVLNADDLESRKLVNDRSITFGSASDAHYRLDGGEVFRKEASEIHLGSFHLKIPGAFNRKNALAATALAMELGVPFETCKSTVESFGGIWRRFEHVGSFDGVEVISDYGHHPTAISATIQAAQECYPGRRIVLCYQPHQHARTKRLFHEFVETFRSLDVPTILAEVYDVAGRNEEHAISSKQIVDEVNRDSLVFANDLTQAESLIRSTVQSGDLLIIMGAGDIDSVARRLR